MSRRLLQWGVIGSGVIAKRFTKDLTEHTTDINHLASVLTRSASRAKSLAEQNKLSADRIFTDFDAFISSGIDVCYIATPHTTHVDYAAKCIERDVNVLVEKPMALNIQVLPELFALAQRRQIFVMEAIWTRFIPAMRRVRQVINDGEIGDLMSIDVDMGFDGTGHPSRLMDPALGGGALYDIGTYALHLATWLCGLPPEKSSPQILDVKAQRRADGVDETFSAILSYPTATSDELMLILRLSVVEDTACTAFLRGKKGYIIIEAPFNHPDSLIINGQRERVQKVGHGLHYETREVYECLRNGYLESRYVPWSDSLNLANTLDRLASHL